MYYSQPRYLKTTSGRIFKLDGWTPILELRNGLWIRPQDFSDEFFSTAEEIGEEEANQNAFFSDNGIETDIIAPYLCYFETLYSLTTFKYVTLVDELVRLGSSSDQFGRQNLVLTLADCCMATNAALVLYGVVEEQFPSWSISVVKLACLNTLVALARKLLPDVSVTEEELVAIANNATPEFDVAMEDRNRVEQVFLTIVTPEKVSSYNRLYHSYACLVNRFFLRKCGCPESDIPYARQGHLLILGSEENALYAAMLNRALHSFVKNDLDALDSIQEGKLDAFFKKISFA